MCLCDHFTVFSLIPLPIIFCNWASWAKIDGFIYEVNIKSDYFIERM